MLIVNISITSGMQGRRNYAAVFTENRNRVFRFGAVLVKHFVALNSLKKNEKLNAQ